MDFVIVSFATYGLTSAIVLTDGPFNIFYKLKRTSLSKLFECFTCCAIWVGLLLALPLIRGASEWILLGLAAAGAAIFLDYKAER